jgi:hypothetical protein
MEGSLFIVKKTHYFVVWKRGWNAGYLQWAGQLPALVSYSPAAEFEREPAAAVASAVAVEPAARAAAVAVVIPDCVEAAVVAVAPVVVELFTFVA